MIAKTNENAGAGTTLLERLDKVVTIDVDTMDSDFIGKLPITPCDMTCNPRWLYHYMSDPVNKELVEKVVRDNKGKRWDEIYCRIAAALEVRIAPLISGRVLAQVSPSHSYDAEYMIWQGRQYSQAWKDVGISADRCCVKVPLTSAGIAAAKVLQAEGIATLGTSLFNIQQAIAAAQVGQYAVSMYFNPPKAWFESSAWHDTEQPASEHPMASRHARMRVIYDELEKRTGKKPPQIKTASFVNSREIVAMALLGCDHVTLNNALLSDLLVPGVPKYRSGLWKVPISQQQGDADFAFEDWEAPSPDAVKKAMAIANADPLTPGETADWLEQALKVDYTAPGVLDKCIEEDEPSRERLNFATEYFSSQEKLSQEFIEELINKLN